MGNMWRLSITSVRDLEADPESGAAWEQVQFKGKSPGKISHHRSVVFGNSVVIFGGNNEYDNSLHAYDFDIQKNHWSQLK